MSGHAIFHGLCIKLDAATGATAAASYDYWLKEPETDKDPKIDKIPLYRYRSKRRDTI